MESNRLKNKNVVITGSSSGIGLLIANQCAERGAHLVLLARRLDKLEKIQKDNTETIFRIGSCVQVRCFRYE